MVLNERWIFFLSKRNVPELSIKRDFVDRCTQFQVQLFLFSQGTVGLVFQVKQNAMIKQTASELFD